MHLRHYFFIGTLNPTLNRLARNGPQIGKAQYPQPKNDGFDHLKSLLFSFAPSPSVSQYTNAFAIAQLCGVLRAPWNGIIMDRHKGKPLDPGNSTLLLQVAPVLSAAARARLPLQERWSRRPTCAPPASPSSPPCRACSSQSAPRFLSSRCSTSPLSNAVPQHCVSSRHTRARTHTHKQSTLICQGRRILVFYVWISVFQPVILGSCTVWPSPYLLSCPCCSTPASPWSRRPLLRRHYSTESMYRTRFPPDKSLYKFITMFFLTPTLFLFYHN